MVCSICRSNTHTARRCWKRPGATEHIRVPGDEAEVLLEMLRPIIRACAWDKNIMESVALSAYLQGALDGQQILSADVHVAVETL